MAYETSLSGDIFWKGLQRAAIVALLFGQFFHLFNGQPGLILSEDAHRSASRNGFFTSSLP
jgi:hypothetical protein